MKIAVFGLGRLGLPWALMAGSAGHDVVGVDLRRALVTAVSARRTDTTEPGVANALADPANTLSATTDPAEALSGAEATFVAVSTPSRADGAFDPRSVLAVVEQVVKHADELAYPHVLVVGSTLTPGTMAGPVAELVAAATRPIHLAHVPEFHALGSVLENLRRPSLVIVGAADPAAGQAAAELVTSLHESRPAVRHLGLTEAELAKLVLNGLLTLRISYANFIGDLATAFDDVDPRTVLAAIQDDPRVGVGFLRPGPPFGGPCFPRDLPALRHSARVAGVPEDLPAAAESVNAHAYVRLIEAATRGLRSDDPVGVAGLAFKSGVRVVDGSPGVELVRRLTDGGWPVVAFDRDVKVSLPAGARWAADATDLLENCRRVLLLDASGPIRHEVLASGRPGGAVIVDAWFGGQRYGILDGPSETF
ncbi:MAG TPA: nucleotide sugar dehydrogenase [Acidimicrobiales bacterium]